MRVVEINIIERAVTSTAVRSVQSEPRLAARTRRVVHDVSGTRHDMDRTPRHAAEAEANTSACCMSLRLGERSEVDQVTVMQVIRHSRKQHLRRVNHCLDECHGVTVDNHYMRDAAIDSVSPCKSISSSMAPSGRATTDSIPLLCARLELHSGGLGYRHLNFYDSRDNLWESPAIG